MKRRGDTKTKLLQTALQLIWQNSYSSVSVDEICNHARVNKGSFYIAYKSKSNLTVAAFEWAWQAKQAILEQCFDKKLPPLLRLDRYCEQLRANQLEKYRVYGKMLGCPFSSIGAELSTRDEVLRQKAEEIDVKTVAYLRGAISELIVEKIVRSANSLDLANEVYSYIIGVVLQAKIENRSVSLGQIKTWIVAFVGRRNRSDGSLAWFSLSKAVDFSLGGK